MNNGDWNVLAGRLTGDGHIDIIETELPIDINSIERNLSKPSAMDGTITNAVRRLKVAGRPIFEPWNTVLIAEASDQIRGMTIYRKPTFTGAKWALDQIGLTGYPIGMPYDGSIYYIDADPLDIFRAVWDHLQSKPNGNLGVTIDQLKSPIRVGTVSEDVTFDTEAGESVAFEAGPRKLNWWDTTDLGTVIDDYAKETPFDWLETLSWQGDEPHCHIQLGYPIIGSRRDDLRLVLGENLGTEPDITQTDYVNQVYSLGAGEGRDRIRGYDGVADGRLRRATVVDDKNFSSIAAANAGASATLAASRGRYVVDTLEVYDHPNAPLAALQPGVDIPLYAETDWAVVDQYVRIVGVSESPQKGDYATVTVVRSEQA